MGMYVTINARISWSKSSRVNIDKGSVLMLSHCLKTNLWPEEVSFIVVRLT